MIIFISSLIKPLDGNMSDWALAFSQLFSEGVWPWANDSIIAQIFHLNEPLIWFEDGVPQPMFFKDISRGVLLGVLLMLVLMVRSASNKRKNAKILTSNTTV